MFPSRQPTRRAGTRRDGSSFTYSELRAVFDKGRPVPGLDPNMWRYDVCGALMFFDCYGDTTPQGFGWEVDHVFPVSKGGETIMINLQPLQWQNNRSKGDLVGASYCTIQRSA